MAWLRTKMVVRELVVVGIAQVALAVYSRLPWICVCGALQHFPAKRTAGR